MALVFAKFISSFVAFLHFSNEAVEFVETC